MTFHWRLAVAACSLAFTAACGDIFGLSPDVKLPISELAVPDTITSQGPLNMTVTVVTGGCRNFDRIVSSRSASVVIVSAWGTDGSGKSQMCTDDIRYEPQQHTIAGPFTDPLVVSAVQPDGTSITRSVTVK